MKQTLYEIYNDDALKAACDELKSIYLKKAYKSVLFHLYCGIDDRMRIARVSNYLKEQIAVAKVVGITSHAEIINGCLTDPVILLSAMFFESADIEVLSFTGLLGDEVNIGQRAAELIDNIPDVKGCEILVQGAPVDGKALLDGISKCRRDIRIFGGYPLGHEFNKGKKWLVSDAGVYEYALIVIVYSGRDFHIDVGHTAGWKSLGRFFKATKASGSVLSEVDGVPAYELYHKYLDVEFGDKDAFYANTMEFPLVLEKNGIRVLRHPLELNDDGSLLLAGHVEEGVNVCMSYGDPNSIIQDVDIRLAEMREFEPEAILLYSCAMRKSFWNYFVNNEMSPFNKIAIASGFFTGGELDRDYNTGEIICHNITLLSIGMREGDKTGRDIPEARVDTTQLHGQASLVQRLITLVQVTSNELQETLDNLTEVNDKLLKMATTDELTALYNRREIERRINEALDNAAKDDDAKVSLIMMDIDHFKSVNDTYGHEAGDKILEGVSAVLNSLVKENNGEAAGRWGGEEFFLVMPDVDIEEAIERAEEIRQTVEMYPFPYVDKLTCSVGVTVTDGTEEKKLVYTRVDDALYEAKETGRNKVVVTEVVTVSRTISRTA